MTWIEWVQAIGFIMAALGGAGAAGAVGVNRWRNGRAGQQQQPQQQQPQHVVQTYPQAPPPQFDAAGDTGQWPAVTDTQRGMLSPTYQAQLLREMNENIRLLADRQNGHGSVRRDEFDRRMIAQEAAIGEIGRKVDQAHSLLGTQATHIAAIRATCAERSCRG